MAALDDHWGIAWAMFITAPPEPDGTLSGAGLPHCSSHQLLDPVRSMGTESPFAHGDEGETYISQLKIQPVHPEMLL